MLIIGDKGKILADFNGNSPRIIPESQMQTYKRPEPYLNRPADGFDQWIEACKGGEPSSASFENVEKLTETVCLGNIALNYSEKLNYDPSENKIVNLEDANKYLSRTVRDQWKF